MPDHLDHVGDSLLSIAAGVSAFVLTLGGFLLLSDLDQQIVASLGMGMLAVLTVWVASDKPHRNHAKAVSSLIDRLLAVEAGDLSSPAPAEVRRQMPALASAVDGLFEQVRSNLENVNAMALYDPVTALPNRLHFKREAERLLVAREPGEMLAMLFIDLDGFKEVNDNWGHNKGDEVLALVADRLREVVKAETTARSLTQPIMARLAGDEFTLLFPILAGAEAEAVAERILTIFDKPFVTGAESMQMGASIGIARCPEHGTDLADLMKAADVAMYHAKATGGQRWCPYDSQFAEALARRTATERALRDGLARDEFELFYQPQIDVRSGEVVACEALVRWRHPLEGLRLPGTFIPVAEESGLILELGDWVLGAVADSLCRWREAGLARRLSFNVSPRQLDQPDFFRRLRERLRDCDIPPELVELEFTETVAMRCSPAVLAELAQLRSEGVLLAIDDFGAGYSNLARLNHMPLDRVKLDRSLIDAIDRSEGTRTIVASVIHLVHGLGAEAIGEGVERPEQLEILRAVGCDIVQGYLFARPMDEAALSDWLAQNNADRMMRA